MSTRWWAPSADGRDNGVTATMLATGDDARADIGLYLLAAHRAGAAVLADVAKSAIPSEDGIAMALAVARAKMGPALVDAMATHLEPTYAGLLVRDVLDAADRGAVDLYRAMVAKGVAPPIATERAGEAYGMPMRAMGAFPAQAADPKANPRAVSDAADRALMSYVSKMADAEAPADAEVTKADLAVRTDFEQQHPRDAGGRFTDVADAPSTTRELSALDKIRARLGLLEVEPTRVAEVSAAAEQPRHTPTRAKRAHRVKRATPVKAPELVPTTAMATAVARAPMLHAIETARTIATVNGKALNTSPPPPPDFPIPDLLKPLPRTGQAYYDIGQPVVIGLSDVEAAGLRTTASNQAMTQKNPGRRIFRMGYMVDRSHYVEQAGKDQHGAHDAAAATTVERVEDRFVEPVQKVLSADEVYSSPEGKDAYLLKQRKDIAARTYTGNDGQKYVVDQEDEVDNHVVALPVYRPYRRNDDDVRPDWAIVHYQRNEGDTRRVRPMVEEYVVEYDARGYEKAAGKHPEISLDPNQVYEVIPSPNQSTRKGARAAPEISYDPVRHVMVNRWFLRPLSEDEIGEVIEGVDKALDVLQARTFEQRHPRGEHGQWTTVAERPTLVSPAARPQRVKRARRVRRAVSARPLQVSAPGQSQSVAVARSAPLQAQVKAQSTPLVVALAKPRPEPALKKLPVLTDTRAYRVLNEEQFQTMLTGLSQEKFTDVHKHKTPLRLTPEQTLALAEHGELEVGVIPEMFVINVGNEIDDLSRQVGRHRLDAIRYHSKRGAPDFQDIAERLHQILDDYPDFDLVELVKDDLESEIVVYGSQVSGSYQNVVEFERDLDLTGEVDLTFIGEYRARDMYGHTSKPGSSASDFSMIGELTATGLQDPTSEGVANPMVHFYRLSTPKVRRYRADNG
jgi:hypothetical protein